MARIVLTHPRPDRNDKYGDAAVAAAIAFGQSAPGEAQLLAGLGPGGHLEAYRAVERRHFDARAEHGFPRRQR